MPKSLLVIDDDPNILSYLSIVFSEAGYDVKTSDTAFNLARRVSIDPPDAILLDYIMPGLDGLLALRELRARRLATPVIIMTATSEQHAAVEFFRAGATDFVAKPFDPDYLLIVVERAIAHHSRNLLDKISAMSRYLAHRGDCDGTPCTCGMRDIAQDALDTVMLHLPKNS